MVVLGGLIMTELLVNSAQLTLDPGLHSMFILGQQRASLSPWFCNLCQESDHSSSQCTLAFLESAPQHQTRDRRSERVTRCICQSWNTSRCIYPGSCYYDHVYLSCRGGHKIVDCPMQRKPAGSSAPTSATK